MQQFFSGDRGSVRIRPAELDVVGHFADKVQAEAAQALGAVQVKPSRTRLADVFEGQTDAFVFNDDDNFVGMILKHHQKPTVFHRLCMADDIGAQLTDNELNVGNVAVNDAHVFQQRMADTPGDPQVGSVAGQIQ